MNTLLNQNLSQIVREHYQAAPIFEKYGLDFCCKGKRPLAAACEEKKIPVETILADLKNAIATETETHAFEEMSLGELAGYIVRVHHTYVKINGPQIASYVERVAYKHGDTFPYMKEVYVLFQELREELIQHMEKEEQILFPRIKLWELNVPGNTNTPGIDMPIQVMENEHVYAGELAEKIRTLTNNYTAPEQACTTFRLALASLKAFEEDLHRHVHLENNILFPKALNLAAAPASCSI